MKWRHPHHWLRGYSDALNGKAPTPLEHHDAASYRAGYAKGESQRLVAAA